MSEQLKISNGVNIKFLIIQKVLAHEEGATQFTTENTLGPVLAFIIIIAAIITAKRIKNSYPQKQKNYNEQKN